MEKLEMNAPRSLRIGAGLFVLFCLLTTVGTLAANTPWGIFLNLVLSKVLIGLLFGVVVAAVAVAIRIAVTGKL